MPSNQTKQCKVLKDKCNHFAKVIHSSHLNRQETQIFYWSIYHLSINYVLPSTYFTLTELSKIQSSSHSAMLSRMGYCRTTPREIIYGSKCLGGAGLFHLYDDQDYGQLKTFLKMWRTPTTQAGKLLCILMTWCQFCVGTGTSVLHNVHSPWPHFESHWIASIRQYLKSVNGHVEFHSASIHPLR